MSESPEQRPDQEDDSGSEGGVEQVGGDQDAGPSGTSEQADVEEQRDQAEG